MYFVTNLNTVHDYSLPVLVSAYRISSPINPHITARSLRSTGRRSADESYTAIENRKKAIGYALGLAKNNDLVLIAGKGHEGYQIVGTKKEHFDDREVAREFLRQRVH